MAVNRYVHRIVWKERSSPELSKDRSTKILLSISLNPDVPIKDVKKDLPAILNAGYISVINHFANGPSGLPWVLTRLLTFYEGFKNPLRLHKAMLL